jgi:hypothetical protein
MGSSALPRARPTRHTIRKSLPPAPARSRAVGRSHGVQRTNGHQSGLSIIEIERDLVVLQPRRDSAPAAERLSSTVQRLLAGRRTLPPVQAGKKNPSRLLVRLGWEKSLNSCVLLCSTHGFGRRSSQWRLITKTLGGISHAFQSGAESSVKQKKTPGPDGERGSGDRQVSTEWADKYLALSGSGCPASFQGRGNLSERCLFRIAYGNASESQKAAFRSCFSSFLGHPFKP